MMELAGEVKVRVGADLDPLERGLARAKRESINFDSAASGSFRRSRESVVQLNSAVMRTQHELQGITAAAGRARAAVLGFAAPLAGVLGTRALMEMADTWTDLTSRVNLAAGSLDEGGEVMGRLGELARMTYSSLEQTTESFLANATALRELGYATEQQLDYTEALNNALVISAARGDRAAAIQNALAKAMAGGKLAGDELNTVIQQGGRVAEALAAGLGVGVNQLRALGAEGKITSRDVFRSLTSQMETLRREAESMPATISDGFQLLKNALLEYVGNGDQARGVSARISEALVIMADNFDQTADMALKFAGVIAGALVGRSLVRMIATLGAGTAALARFTRALTAARSAGALTAALGGLGAAAGPAGLVIGGALVTALTLFSDTSAQASDGAQRFSDRLQEIESSAEKSADKVEEAGARYNEAMKNALTHEVSAATNELENAQKAAVDLLSEVIQLAPAFQLVRDEAGNLSRQPFASPDQLQQLNDLRDALAGDAAKAEEAKDELYALANSNPNFQKLADQMQPILDRLALVVQGARQAAAELAVVSQSNTGGGGPVSRGGAGQARRALEASRAQAAEYEKEALRRAALTRDQLSLENEIARVRNDSLKEGIKLTEDQVARIAQANVTGNSARSSSGRSGGRSRTTERADDYERLSARIAESTAALVHETEVQRGLNPLVDDFGFAVEKARTEFELLAAAQEAGKAITPALRSEIAGLAEQYGLATAEAAKLREEQMRAQEQMQFYSDLTKGALSDLRSALSDGKLEWEELADVAINALERVSDRGGDDNLDMLFQKDLAA